jgi:hypothetical protein
MLHLVILFAVSFASATNIPKTTDDIVIKSAPEYLKSWHERLARPSAKYTEWMLAFEFLVNHHAFYDGEQYLLEGLPNAKENDLIVATLMALEWNVSWRTVHVLDATYSGIHDSDTMRPRCRVIETDHPSVHTTSGYRSVINMKQAVEHAYTDHQMYVDVRYWRQDWLERAWGVLNRVDDCILHRADKPWLIPVIELTLPPRVEFNCKSE